MNSLKGIIFALVIGSCACALNPTSSDQSVGGAQSIPKPPGRYEELIEKWSGSSGAYHGLSAAYHVSATLLSRDIVEYQVYLDSQKYNWTVDQYNDARKKALYDLQTSTTVMVSLYTEKDEDNNLDKSTPEWNLFLNVQGKRVAPQNVKRIYDNRVALLAKYPDVDVWSRNYYVKFPIPTDDAAAGTDLNLAGPLGSASLKFPK